MRVHALLLVALVGCSTSSVSPTPSADSGSPDDVPDTPEADRASLDAVAIDVADVPAGDARPMDVLDGFLADQTPRDVLPDTACASPGETRCGEACVDTRTDFRHCGACGNECCTGQVCVAGSCAFVCNAGSTVCPVAGSRCGVCVDTRTDPANCGACGNACRAGTPCVNGSCLPCGGCAAGTTCCGSACVNLQTDTNHCGQCGRVCATGRPCSAGTCIADDCPGGQFCAGVCRQTMFDNANCGGCGQQCCAGNVCTAGMCTPACAPGMTACPGPMSSCRGGVCVNLVADVNNCGGCGVRCAAGETCASGSCRAGAFMALAPCSAAGDYQMATTVRFGGTLGSVYSPPCVTVRAGTSVTWEGSFAGHPLSPSTRGTAMNPITRVASGSSATVTFPRAGFYPFFCEFHGSDSGSGMAGVVQVIE